MVRLTPPFCEASAGVSVTRPATSTKFADDEVPPPAMGMKNLNGSVTSLAGGTVTVFVCGAMRCVGDALFGVTLTRNVLALVPLLRMSIVRDALKFAAVDST